MRLPEKLWSQTSIGEKNELLYEQTGIDVTPELYETKSGAKIWLQHSEDYERDFAFLPSDYGGCIGDGKARSEDLFTLELVFILDGKTLVCTKTDIDLGVTVTIIY